MTLQRTRYYELSGEEKQPGGKCPLGFTPSVLPVELESQLDLPGRPARGINSCEIGRIILKVQGRKRVGKVWMVQEIEELATKLQVGCF